MTVRINSLPFPVLQPQVAAPSQSLLDRLLFKSPEVEQKKKQELQGRIGTRLSTAVEALSQAAGRKLESKIGTKLSTGLQKVVNPEMSLDQLTDDLVQIVNSTSPQQIGETLNIVTLFLRKYQEVFAKVAAHKAQGRLATQDYEDAYWNAQMGEFSISKIYAAIEGHHAVPISTLDDGILSPRIRFKRVFETLIKFCAGSTAEAAIKEWQDTCRQDMHRWEPDVKGSFLFQVKSQLDTLAADLEENYGIELTHDELQPMTDNCFLVERVGTRDIVFYTTPGAQEKGIYPGLEADIAEARWNALRQPTDPAAVIERTNFGGRKSIRQTLHEIVLAVLTQPTTRIYNAICEQLLAIPYVGRPLALLFKIMAWLGTQTLRGVNYFVGLPSREALANEITSNIMLHLANPTFFATPLLVVDRLFQILERRATETPGTAVEHQEAFLGEFVLEIGSLMNTICPSLFRLRTSRIIRAFTYASLWIFRKVGLRLLVNARTERVARRRLHAYFGNVPSRMQRIDRAITWVRESAVELRRSGDLLASTHTILQSGYRLLGDFGMVSRDQTHYDNAGQSLAHLIHHTIIAAARIFITKKYLPNHQALQLQLQDMTPAEFALLGGPLAAKRQAILNVDFPRAQELRQLAQNVQELNVDDFTNFLSNTLDWVEGGYVRTLRSKPFLRSLEAQVRTWNPLIERLDQMAQDQKNELGEVDPELIILQKQLQEFVAKMEALHRGLKSLIFMGSQESKEKNIATLKELEMAFHEQNRLRMQVVTFFTVGHINLFRQVATLEEQLLSLTPDISQEQLAQLIEARLSESEAATFASSYEAEERRLEAQLQEIERQLEVENEKMHRMRQGQLNDPMVRESLKGLNRAHKLPAEEQVPGTTSQSWWKTIFFEAPSQEVKFERGLDWQMELHLGHADEPYLNKLAELFALKHALRQKLHQHRAWTNAKVVLFDPAWILAQSGEQMVAFAKKMIPGGRIKASLDTWWVPQSAPAVPIASSSEGAQPVYAPPPPRAHVPEEDALTNYFEEMAFYRLANFLRNAVGTAT
jgi:hypothetical protein